MRGSSRARGTPGPSGLDGTREATPTLPMTRSVGTPGPSRFSTSYGSPVVLTGSRAFSGRSATNAIGAAVQNVQDANEQDRQSRAEREASNAPYRDDDAVISEDHDNAGAMPPPPRPRQRR